MSEVCESFHNMLIKMEQVGEVYDEDDDKVVRKMYNKE